MRSVFCAAVLLLSAPAFAQNASKPREWREWLAGIVDGIDQASRTNNRDLLERRINRPIQFLGTSSGLTEERNIRVFCTLAAQSATNYAADIKRGKRKSARAELADYRKYDRDCAEAIEKLERETKLNAARAPSLSTSGFPATASAPKDWLAAVRADAATALDAVKRRKADPVLFDAIAVSAVAARARIASWAPAPKNSSAYGICGDAVIALSKLSSAPAEALETYFKIEPSCARAIGE